MDDPPFRWELITCNFDNQDDLDYPVQHFDKSSKGKQLLGYSRAVRQASSETDIFHLNQTDLRLGAPTAVAVANKVPIVAGPNISTFHSEALDDALPILSKKRWMMNFRASKAYRSRLLYHRFSPVSSVFDGYVAFTPHHKKKLIQSGLSPEKIEILPSGTRPDIFYPSASGEPDPVPNIFFVGTPCFRKGFDIFLDALSCLQEDSFSFSATVIGSADEEAKAAVVDRSLEEIVDFVGRIPRAQLTEYYCKADVVVNPSRYETEGMVSVESRACGTPVIGSDIEALKEKNTLTFRNGDPDDLSKKLRQYLSERSQYQKSALATADDWSVIHSINVLENIYVRCLSNN